MTIPSLCDSSSFPWRCQGVIRALSVCQVSSMTMLLTYYPSPPHHIGCTGVGWEGGETGVVYSHVQWWLTIRAQNGAGEWTGGQGGSGWQKNQGPHPPTILYQETVAWGQSVHGSGSLSCKALCQPVCTNEKRLQFPRLPLSIESCWPHYSGDPHPPIMYNLRRLGVGGARGEELLKLNSPSKNAYDPKKNTAWPHRLKRDSKACPPYIQTPNTHTEGHFMALGSSDAKILSQHNNQEVLL